MPRHLRVPLAAALLPLVLTACGASASDNGSTSEGRDPDTLVVAAIPSENSTSLAQQYAPIVKLLEAETGKKVQMQKATSYAAVIEAQRAHKADVALYGPLSYVVAKDSGVGVKLAGALVAAKGETPGSAASSGPICGSPSRSRSRAPSSGWCWRCRWAPSRRGTWWGRPGWRGSSARSSSWCGPSPSSSWRSSSSS
ncbi:PhnD/SsuA/transferrin family substrate-binding protein [Streptomyces sp. DASNCL29]|uniref:PhnD/SsuA/transferrin family substrate-binding protein n=1 Tax=Streptomyces sp. DASNCL29 TaxID=2583819 RepID=UPI001F0CF8DF|nr:PhnD/SsuA/transferrin family substrate-binding protein [Streptomyces sp. DASNCL29]